MRDFKKFTARTILSYVENDIECRKDWMLHQFKYYASTHSRNEHYQLWTHENHFVELFTPLLFEVSRLRTNMHVVSDYIGGNMKYEMK